MGTEPPVLHDLLLGLSTTRAPTGSNRQNFRFVVLRDGPVAGQAKALLGEAFLSGWNEKRASDGYGEGTGSVSSSTKARQARAMQHFVDHFEQIPAVVLACTRLRHHTLNDDPNAGYDYRILSIQETTHNGTASLGGLNPVYRNGQFHSGVDEQVMNPLVGVTVCKTGTTARTFGHYLRCGSIMSLGAAGGATGTIHVPATISCRGDSGGPVWTRQGSQNFAVGLVSGLYGTIVPNTGDNCQANMTFVSLNRQLAHAAGAYTFFNPEGSELTRRTVVRWFDLLLNREPDASGLNYWTGHSCNAANMEHIAFAITATGAEFDSVWPMSTYAQTTNRVRSLYEGLYDRALESSYWPDVIWTSGNSHAARKSTADWVAWIFVTNGGSGSPNEFDARMTSTGSEGAPPMCQGVDW